MTTKSKNIFEVYRDWIPYIIIGVGILLRIVVFIQNRSLEVDEANVARNIFERGFAGLLSPLSYQQFAPPGFLWMLEIFTNLFGFGEQAFRIFLLLCGIVYLWLFYLVLRHFVSNSVSWYPLALLATGYIYIYYATEIKQYASDVLIGVGLLLMALQVHLDATKPLKFLLLWLGTAIVAMWFSMPSVFILSGIGLYYLYPAIVEKSGKLKWIIAVIIGWALLFAGYYFLFLERGIVSEELKMYHERYFIELVPTSPASREKTYTLLKILMMDAAGDISPSTLFNTILFFTGIGVLIYKHKAKAFLLVTPVIALYVAAAFQQFTLLARVVMFIMPVMLILIAVGFNTIFNIPNIAPKLVLIALALFNIGNFHSLKYFSEPLLFEEMRDALYEVKREQIPPERFHVNALLEPAFIYYTTIHPDKDDWKELEDAVLLPWAEDYDSVAQSFTKDAVLYGWYPQDRLDNEFNSYYKYCNLKKIDIHGMNLYICYSKQLPVQY